MNNFSAISIVARTSYIWWGDNKFQFVLEHFRAVPFKYSSEGEGGGDATYFQPLTPPIEKKTPNIKKIWFHPHNQQKNKKMAFPLSQVDANGTALTWIEICIVLAHWNNSPQVGVLLHLDMLSWFRTNQSLAVSVWLIIPNE